MSTTPEPPKRMTINFPAGLRRRVRRVATAEHRDESSQVIAFVEAGVRGFEAAQVTRVTPEVKS